MLPDSRKRLLGMVSFAFAVITAGVVMLTPAPVAALEEGCHGSSGYTSHGGCLQNHCWFYEDGQRCNDGNWQTGPNECDCPPLEGEG